MTTERAKSVPLSGHMAWAARANELASWAWALCVNRTDVWGGYNPVADRKKKYVSRDGKESELGPTTTRPRQSRRGKEFLTKELLAGHFRATKPEHVVGLHTTSSENTSRWGAVEIDWHGEGSTGPEVNLRAALGWYGELTRLGFRPLLTDSNGRGGYHLRVLLAEPVPTPRMFWFLRGLVRDHVARGLPAAPETFPKQSSIEPGRFGNWLRLPGLHHTRPHWAQVWDGGAWADGDAAVDFMLSLAGDPPTLIPQDVEWQYRIGEYLAKLPNKGEGQGRDDVAFGFLAFLVRDLHLDDEYALQWANSWDSANSPPKGPEQLREILANVHKYGKRGYGSGLNGANGTARPCTTPAAALPKPDDRRGEKGEDPEDGEPKLTDRGNATRLAREHGRDLRHVHPWRKWLCWDGKRWRVDDSGAVQLRAKRLIAAMFRDAVGQAKDIQKQLEEMADGDGD